MESITLKTLNNELQEDTGDLQSQLNTQVEARTSAVASLQDDIAEIQADLQEHVPYPATQGQDSETIVVDRGLDGQALVSTGSGTTTWRDLPATFVSAATVTPDSSYSGANGIALATVAVTAGDGGTQQTTSSEIRMPVAVKNPNKLTVRMPTEETDEETGNTVEGTEDVEYDGSAAVSLDIAGLFENVLTLTNANTVDIETFGQEMDERVGGLEDRMDTAENTLESLTSSGDDGRVDVLEDQVDALETAVGNLAVNRSMAANQNGSVSDSVSVSLGAGHAQTHTYTIRETLWSNDAPTTAKSSITAELSSSVNNYLFWTIQFKWNTTTQIFLSTGVMVGANDGRLVSTGNGTTNNRGVTRSFTLNQNGDVIEFANGYCNNATDTSYAIPVSVYGFFPITS